MRGESYRVKWDTKRFGLDDDSGKKKKKKKDDEDDDEDDEDDDEVGPVFRITVRVGDQVLGLADVQLVETARGRGFRKGVRRNTDPILLEDGRKLNIRFRIEQGALAQSKTVTISPAGGTVELEGVGLVVFPAGAFDAPRLVTVSATATQETRATFELSARFLSIDTRVAREFRVNTGQVAPTTPTEITLTVPEEFVAALPPADGAAVFVQLLQDGGQDLLDNFVRLELAAFDPATSTITTLLSSSAFTNLRRADGTFEAIIVIGSAPKGIGGVPPLKALAAAAQEMCEEAIIESPLEAMIQMQRLPIWARITSRRTATGCWRWPTVTSNSLASISKSWAHPIHGAG